MLIGWMEREFESFEIGVIWKEGTQAPSAFYTNLSFNSSAKSAAVTDSLSSCFRAYPSTFRAYPCHSENWNVHPVTFTGIIIRQTFGLYYFNPHPHQSGYPPVTWIQVWATRGATPQASWWCVTDLVPENRWETMRCGPQILRVSVVGLWGTWWSYHERTDVLPDNCSFQAPKNYDIAFHNRDWER